MTKFLTATVAALAIAVTAAGRRGGQLPKHGRTSEGGRKMKKVLVAALAALSILLLGSSAAATTKERSALASTSSLGAGVTLASGSFTLLGPEFGLPNGTNRTFAFTVKESSDGTITGQAEVNSFAPLLTHIAINCFQVVGNEAIIGGVTTQSSDPDLLGVNRVFAVEDNPDVATFVFNASEGEPPLTCANLGDILGEPDLATLLTDFGLPIVTGNIMIRQAN